MLHRLDLRARLDPPGRARELQLRSLLPRPRMDSVAPVDAVQEILEAVRNDGDTALRELTKRFDGAEIDAIEVPRAERQRALSELNPLLREALEEAHANIVSY